MTSSGSWNHYQSMMLLLFLINLVAFATAQDQNPYSCMNNGNYTSNSTYSANLNSLLSSLASNISDTGFYSASVGRSTDTVNAVVLCRGDQTLDQCRTCVQNAAVGLVQLCPNQRQAIVWYELCTLRYSNEPLYGIQTNDPGVIMRNSFNVSSAEPFIEDRTTLLDDLRRRAANGSSVRKVGAGFRNTSNSETIYGLLQCTPDLSPENCDDCLNRASQLRGCCNTARGVRILLPSCNLRYELYSFYNETRLRELQLLAPPPPPPPPPSTPSSPTPSPPGKKGDNTTRNIIIIVVAIALFLLIAVCAAIYLWKRIKRKPEEATDEISSVESLQFDFGKIRDATNDFSDANKLGQGGFGAVYRGKLSSGQEIAVKRLSRESGQGNIEFKNEVLLVAKLQHRNLVRLLGFSVEGTERLLIYEFVENASLDQFIFDPIKRSHLDWDRRYKIIAGIARGLVYLHEDSRLRIIHRDLKASNVLLDGDMNPKIADFGMARLVGQDETQRNTSKIVGTYGYMSPEYAMHGQFSVKSDVFSFGVLVLEIISGQRNNCFQNGESTEDLLSFTWKNWRDGTAANVIDPVLRADSGSRQDMLRCIHIGLLCVQENGANRPTMASVVLMLNSTTITLQVPSEPPFLMSTHFGPDISRFQDYDSNSSKASRLKAGISEGSSQNEVSVTDLYPR
ncbi:UNVERIFIED_CONTAM: Cysteine-rich receptor-like protein kinase [Sesamum radiatum]|uniref:Cysteine-rich receptor-like protein kinase n=1 Tax=Sesamum radiatum TaxID=300843 RepID=A0AAW2T1N6_SESRA